ncbi:MAG: hypothetical protein WA943_15850 [Parvibaculum sp.]|uniref:hypothetical protein n=1 Tax=Parvibaculum sp. TaxID=2024848 RepID=UPI003C727C01
MRHTLALPALALVSALVKLRLVALTLPVLALVDLALIFLTLHGGRLLDRLTLGRPHLLTLGGLRRLGLMRIAAPLLKRRLTALRMDRRCALTALTLGGSRGTRLRPLLPLLFFLIGILVLAWRSVAGRGMGGNPGQKQNGESRNDEPFHRRISCESSMGLDRDIRRKHAKPAPLPPPHSLSTKVCRRVRRKGASVSYRC